MTEFQCYDYFGYEHCYDNILFFIVSGFLHVSALDLKQWAYKNKKKEENKEMDKEKDKKTIREKGKRRNEEVKKT